MKTFFLCLLVWVSSVETMAQSSSLSIDSANLSGQRATTNVRGAQYPRLLSDHRAVFKVKAPNAHKVQLDLGKKYDMQSEADGMWTCITEPLSEGFHYYSLIIDGFLVADPASESFYGCGMMSSGIEVPYPEGINHFYLSDVPHGDIRMNRYYSTKSNQWKRMFVYTPHGYDGNDQTYPVLYLLHGGGEDERGWVNQGRTDVIMDNLIARNESTPMIIAMLDGNASDFEGELLTECIPFVEKNYRVKADKKNRALAGLSMGGIQTLNVGIAHPDLFSYLGVFSSGWWATPPKGFQKDNNTEKYYELLRTNTETYNKEFKLFWLSMGGKEDIAYHNCQIMKKRFDEIGIKYTYFETPGGHTWPVWRESLYRFAPMLFK